MKLWFVSLATLLRTSKDHQTDVMISNIRLPSFRIYQNWWFGEKFHQIVDMGSDSFFQETKNGQSPIAKEQIASIHSNRKHHNIAKRWRSMPHKYSSEDMADFWKYLSPRSMAWQLTGLESDWKLLDDPRRVVSHEESTCYTDLCETIKKVWTT